MKTLVLGLGNPFLSDDGVGVRVAELLSKRIKNSDVEVMWEPPPGLDILDAVRGYDRLIVVDALVSEDNEPGEIRRMVLSDLPSSRTLHLSSQHDASFATALDVGKRLWGKVPSEVVVYGIVVENVRDFGEMLSPRVRRAVPKAAKLIGEELRR